MDGSLQAADAGGHKERGTGGIHTVFPKKGADFDWEDDRLPAVPAQDCIIYKIHPRGFTKHASSGLSPEKRGTFEGVIEKISYLKELGITTLEMMPPVEFNEIILRKSPKFSVFPRECGGKNRKKGLLIQSL